MKAVDPDRTARTAETNALRLVAAVRDLDQLGIAAMLADLDRADVEALAVTLAAMHPGDVHPPTALRWVEVSPDRWPMDVLVAECGRYDAGDRDTTANAAAAQVARLAAQSEARAFTKAVA